jgi:CBS domain containing-hemolysin-like protein
MQLRRFDAPLVRRLEDREQRSHSARSRDRARGVWIPTLASLLSASEANASFLSGDLLDTVADVLAWIVLFLAPIIAIAVFWMVHILPEKIAEKRRHPQAAAIKTLCLLSLFFGGLLWPLAWLWAYSKPVLHKLAYGTDVAPEHEAPHSASESVSESPGEIIIEETTSEEIAPATAPDTPHIQRARLHKTRVDTH